MKKNKIIEADKNLLPLTEADKKSEQVDVNLQQVFYRDIGATMPTLLDQLSAKDQQIDQLSKTVTALIERNSDLQKRILSYETNGSTGGFYTYDHNQPYNYEGIPPKNRPPSGFWEAISSRQYLVIIGLLIFLLFGLKAFDYFDGQTSRENTALLDEYRSQRQDYTQMVGEYETKISTLETEKNEREQHIHTLSYTIDTLSNAVSMLSLQLNKEGNKSETINTLTQQLGEKEQVLSKMARNLDSLRAAYQAEKMMAEKLEEKTKLLETVNTMNQAAAKNDINFNANLLYILIAVLVAAVLFVLFDRRR
jgi:predicted RNase H-like nuclease (RuvC/YqgF family)